MEGILSRETLGRFGQHGWRPGLIGWGIGLPLVALMWVVVYRVAIGTASLTDLGVLLGGVIPFVNYMRERAGNSTVGRGPPTIDNGAVINPHGGPAAP